MRTLLLIVALGAFGAFGALGALALPPLPQSNPGTIAGQLSKDGKPVAGVRVIALDATDTGIIAAVAQTDETGKFRLSISPGRYLIAAGLLDTPTYYPGVPSSAVAKVVTVTSGGTVGEVNFPISALSFGISVKGRVIRPGAPSPGERDSPLTASLVRTSGPTGPPNSTSVKPDGTFEFQNVVPGIYGVRVQPAPFAETPKITVVDKDIDGIEVLIPATVTITGAVFVEGGGLAPRLSLTFSPYDGGQTTSSFTVTNGVFIASLPEGDYRVGWTALPANYSIASIKLDSTDSLTERLRLSTKTSAAAKPIDIKLRVAAPLPWVKVSGRVVGIDVAAGSPPKLTLVRDPVASATNPLPALPIKPLAADGTFEFPMVPAGTYQVQITPAPTAMSPTSLVVSNRDLTDVRIVIPAVREISGRVEVEGNGPIPDVTFSLLDPATGKEVGVVNATSIELDGTFKLALPLINFRLQFSSNRTLPQGYAVKSLTYGGIDLKAEPMNLSSDSAPSELNLTFSTLNRTWQRVSGTATGPGVDPSKHRVTLVPITFLRDGPPQSAPIHADGSFEFPAVFVGTYSAQITPGIEGVQNSDVSVDVSNKDISDVRLVRPLFVVIETDVSISGGGAVPNLRIQLSDDNGNFFVRRANPQAGQPFAVTLPAGEHHVSLTNLPPAYSVKSFTYRSTDLMKEAFKVSVDAPTVLRIELDVAPNALFKISGRVVGLPPVTAATDGPPRSITLSAANQRIQILPIEVPLAPDGAFVFPPVFPGVYELISGFANPIAVSVINKDVSGIEIRSVFQ